MSSATIPGGDLCGHVVLVTGASRGIGRAVAIACAQAGAEVILAARDVRRLGEVSDTIIDAGGPSPVLVPINLEAASVDDYAMVADHIRTQFGRLDGLVLAAAMLGELTPLNHYDPLVWARVFQVNVHSALLLGQACWPLLRESGRGSIVVTLAEQAFDSSANWGAYAVSKHALRGLFQTWAAECGTGDAVRVNAVVPQPVRTRLRLEAFPGLMAEDFPPPETVAGVYVELLTDKTRTSNGLIVHAPVRSGVV